MCRLEELARRSAKTVVSGGLRIAVFRTETDQLHALEDRCPHRGAPLSEGVVYEGFVACRDHGWSICLADGVAAPPERGQARTFPIKVEDGVIWVLPSSRGNR